MVLLQQELMWEALATGGGGVAKKNGRGKQSNSMLELCAKGEPA